MYFAIIWNHPNITIKELDSIHPKNLQQIWNQILIFDTDEAGKLDTTASIIKRGKILPFYEIEKHLSKTKILGIADKVTGINFKKKYNIKRFKQVDILHTDIEVKNKGIELIKIKGEYGIVQWYQNIKLYEIIDFDKPARSMQVGMMPAKLTHSLINIGLTLLMKENKWNHKTLIFDPFCGTGTTGFLANALWYHFIGSDIKPSRAYKNKDRRIHSKYFQDKVFEFYEQDISKPLTNQFNVLKDYETIIITEGRLGPVIKQTTTLEQIKEYQRRVKNLYLQFIQTITDFFPKNKRPPMVFTIPVYTSLSKGKNEGESSYIEEQISFLASQLWRKIETIDEVYKRENQKVWRKILILQ